MKKSLLTLLSILIAIQLYAQKMEYSIQANSGLFHYSGNSTAAVSFINSAGTPDAYVNNPYGSKNGFCYGGDLQAQYVGKSGFIMGLQAGYAFLRSEAGINRVYPPYAYVFYTVNSSYNGQAANGKAFLQNQSISLNPYIGYRLQFKKIKIDLMPGFNLGFSTGAYEKAKAASDGTTYTVDQKQAHLPTDLSIKFGAAAIYKKWGITASFAHGITNYTTNLSDDSPVNYQAHSELLQFGISYRIF